MSKLLINDRSLVLIPSLAKKIGVNEAIILQQVHYWLEAKKNKNNKNTVIWVYNSYSQWAEQFGFWSEITIRRTIRSLEKQGLLIAKNLNKNQFSKKKWYTIDYIKLTIVNNIPSSQVEAHVDMAPKVQFSESDIGDNNIASDMEFAEDLDKNISITQLHADLSTELEHKLPEELESVQNSIETKKEIESDQNDHIMRSKRSEDPIKLIASYIDTKNTTKNNNLSLSLNQESSKAFSREKIMIKKWNEIIEKNNRIIALNSSRTKNLNKILAEFFKNDLSLWEEFCQKIMKSRFLRGEVTNFKIQLDWILKKENLIKVMEGNYHREEELQTPKTEINQASLIEEIENLKAPKFWKDMMLILMQRKGIATFCAWFKKNEFVSLKNGILEIKSFSKFAAHWINTHYLDDILNAGKEVYQKFEEIKFSYAS